ncbi:hypothetical protein [Shouchella lehensis]|uniref:Uncharacterized protein n=1 Tax=Shouchella lehensis G1 TaxID=1246626 RepID=A0A060LTS0_9BACI|nr:hypothetical protein [Shouchella lehensis]AIC93400.1 hypothetical protein BleG1_0792 [Shouchella lehensis G1]
MASTIGSTAKTTGQIEQEQQNTQQENRNHLTYDDEVIKKNCRISNH